MIEAGQVVGSIVMFGAIYILLFFVWVFVLHQKITHGPEPVEFVPKGEPGGVFEAATTWSGHRDSLTERRE